MNYINIRISADSLNFEKLNDELNFDNSVICKKGNIGEYKGEKFTFSEDIWQSKIEVTDDDLIENLRLIVDKLYGKKLFLQTLPCECDFSIWITIYSERIQSNFRFDKDILNKISAIGASLDITVMNLQEFYEM